MNAQRTVTATAMLSGSLAPLNSTMIVVALPSILTDLGAPLTWGSWIIVSYLVSMAAVQPLGGRLGDRYGDARLLMAGLVCFLAASALAALAPNVIVLIVARTAQALSGAIALPNGSALIRRLVPFTSQGRAFGIVGAGIGVAAALGPPLGGVVTEALGWRMTFLANVAVIVPALLLAARLPRSVPPTEAANDSELPAATQVVTAAGRRGFDAPGAAGLVVALVALALSLTIWRVPEAPAWATPALVVVALATGAWLLRHLRRVAEPVLDLGLFGRSGFLAAGTTILLSNMVMYTIFIAVPLFLDQVLGWEPSSIGMMLAAMSVPMLALGPVGGALADRYGKRTPALIGCGVAALGVAWLTLLDANWSGVHLGLALAIVGLGVGLSSAPVHTAALHAAPRHQAGQAAGLFSTMRYLGSVIGSAGIAAILGVGAFAGAYRTAFTVLAAVSICAVYSASRLPGREATAVANLGATHSR